MNGVPYRASKLTAASQSIVHFRQRSHSLTTASFTLGELVIPISSQYIYLGIPLDEHLTFQMAIHSRIEKALSSFYAIVGHLMKIGWLILCCLLKGSLT